jgi:DNA-binding CsgD family transcriptional regulator
MKKWTLLIDEFDRIHDVNILKAKMQWVAESFGFAYFNFMDTGDPSRDVPFYLGTTPQTWQDVYISNGFADADPYLTKARRFNLPFFWGKLPDIPVSGGRKSNAGRLFDAVRDFRFSDGLIIPMHFNDALGRPTSALLVYFWTGRQSEFNRVYKDSRLEIHVVSYYWAQRVIDLLARQKGREAPFRGRQSAFVRLTDREREVLQLAAWGKTNSVIADQLNLSENTVETYFRKILEKLSAPTKTAAVSIGIGAKLIEPMYF